MKNNTLRKIGKNEKEPRLASISKIETKAVWEFLNKRYGNSEWVKIFLILWFDVFARSVSQRRKGLNCQWILDGED